jgi:hypothetical protein
VSEAQSSTTLFVVALVGSTSPTFRAKVTGVTSSARTPTGTVSFTINGSGSLQCDGLTNTVSMSGGVATCRVTSALPTSGTPETAQATYSGDGNFTASVGAFTASGGTFTASGGNFSPSVPLVVTPPVSIPDDCSSDAAPALLSWLSSLPQGTASKPVVVKFPAQACYVVNESLYLRGMTNITVNGNGSIFKRSNAAPSGVNEPMLMMTQDSNITISGLTLQGGYDGAHYGGVAYEGDYGILMEADHGISFDHLNVRDIQGDFMALMPPNDANPPTGDLNTAIMVTNSTFVQAGYHGLSVESVNGLTVAYNHFRSMGVDAMDFEYDNYSTDFYTPGVADWAAQDNVTIAGNTWKDWGNDWFASIQGQTPGVQFQHLTLYGNVLESNGPIFEVVGTNPALTTPLYSNDYWTIEYNTFVPGYYGYPYRGGLSVAGQLYDISHLTMDHNTFPLCGGLFETPEPEALCSAPNEYMLDLDVITDSTIEHNDFSGALGVVLPQPYNTYNTGLTECGNDYGVNAAQLDATCASAMDPTGVQNQVPGRT